MIKNADAIKAAASAHEIIREFVNLDKRGANYVGLCPFHKEKTPSFTVNPNRNTYKCFGCGESGDAIQFLIDYKGMTYPEALEHIARAGRVIVEYEQYTNREEFLQVSKERKQKQAVLKQVASQVQEWYWRNTWNHIATAGSEVYEFAGRAYTWETIRRFQLCYAPEGNQLLGAAQAMAWDTDQLVSIGVLSIYKERNALYDLYRERFLFPITDHMGNVIGWGGRKCTSDKNPRNPKYINSPDTDLYDKSEALYALAQNRNDIRQAGQAILVEGYTDVVTLAEYGFPTAVASCGTALTEQQAKLLKRYTEEVLIWRDGDDAGRKAAIRDVEILLKAGLAVKVALLPDGEDPDSFVRKYSRAEVETYLEEKAQDGLIWRTLLDWDDSDVFAKERAFNTAGELLASMESTTLRETYIRELTKKNRMGSVRKQLLDRIDHYEKKSLSRTKNFSEIQERSILEFGLYEKNNRYFVSSDAESEGFSVSNFIIRPIMLIIGAQASQRLVEIKNEYGKSYVINADATIFTSLTEFKKATERMGNFLFTGKPEFYERVKAKVYRESKDCFPISVMGWHREGFYTWGNGISLDGRFREVDEFGVVEYEGTRYFLPAFSRLQENIKSDDVEEEFEYEKKFAFYGDRDCISFDSWNRQMLDVHGWNGAMAVAFACAALFRDIIFQKFQFFPHLNMFGPSGSGKTFLARSVMALFGRSNQHDPFNLSSGTPVAFKRRLAQVSNGIIWFDEYSNDVDFRRVEALKGAYDGAGHERGLATQDNRTKTTKVKSGLMLSGQQQPTKDIALFKRVISLNCKSGNNTLERQQRAKKLKSIEETGQLTQVTQYLLQYRSQIEEHFSRSFEQLRVVFNKKLQDDGRVVEDRIVNNHLIPVAVVDVLKTEVEFGFKYGEFLEWAYGNIIEQSDAIYNEDELSIFWRILEYLHSKGMADPKAGIHHKEDILIEEKVSETFQDELNSKNRKDSIVKDFRERRILIYIRFPRLHPEYQERHQRQRGKNGLDLGALQYYLRTSPAYLGQKRNKKFGDKNYSCYVFDLEQLPIELPLTVEVEGE